MIRFFLLFIIAINSSFGLGQSTLYLEIPKTSLKDSIIYHSAYSLSFNQQYKQANWVAYLLTQKELIKTIDRNDKFVADPLIPSTNFINDYKKSGYDRGHLAPAGDMVFSEISMKESFYFSNISPQNPSFNRGIWNNLEENIRKWVKITDSIYIVTGPILEANLKTIGPNKIAVPNYYYKVILNTKIHQEKAIAFLIPNNSSEKPLETYIITVDELETKTGFDFFYLLPDEIETKVESQVCYECWNK